MVRRLVDADLELGCAFGRDPLCPYQSPEGVHPSRIDGLLVDTRLAALLHAPELLQRGAISGHIPVRFDRHLKVASEQVVKFIRPKPVELAPREAHEHLLMVHRLRDPIEAGWRAALSTGDVDQAWAFWTTGAEETLQPLFARTLPRTPPPRGPPCRWPRCTCPRAQGPTSCVVRCTSAPNSTGTTGGRSCAP